MADEADQAQEQIEASLAHALRAATRQPKLQSNGDCHSCFAPIPRGWLFCDALCREDYERVEAARIRSGNIAPD